MMMFDLLVFIFSIFVFIYLIKYFIQIFWTIVTPLASFCAIMIIAVIVLKVLGARIA